MPKLIRRSKRLLATSQAGGQPSGEVQKRPTRKRLPTKKGDNGSGNSDNDAEDPPSMDRYPEPQPKEDPSPGDTNPSTIKQPISGIIHENLKTAWKINNTLPMCFIFDVVSPARRFKRGMAYDDEVEFPEYDEEKESGNVTETDEGPNGLMPYVHDEYTRMYHFECSIGFDSFMDWEREELRSIRLGEWGKQRNKNTYKIQYRDYQVPAPYDRLISQLVAECLHGDRHDSYESRRRAVYALKTLDKFGDELTDYKRRKLQPAAFRSRVLTPILQRQRVGLYDGYTPCVRAGVSSTAEGPSIQDATSFYLRADPTDPRWIPSYCHNLLYIPESRWHLGVLMGVAASDEAAIEHYNKVKENHDKIMESLRTNGVEKDKDDVRLLSLAEVRAIISEGIEDFFYEELRRVPERVATVTENSATTSS